MKTTQVIENGIEYKVSQWYGETQWHLQGQLHREGGPAVISPNGSKYWYRHGKLHREDGPAIIYSNGHQLWYYQDQCLKVKTQEEYEQWLKLKTF